jgi:hypothetical protein
MIDFGTGNILPEVSYYLSAISPANNLGTVSSVLQWYQIATNDRFITTVQG